MKQQDTSSFTSRQLLILHDLFHLKNVNSKLLAFNIGVSQRTIKNEISILKEMLVAFGIELKSIPGQGYELINVADDNTIYDSFFNSNILKMVNIFHKENFERVNYIVLSLLLDNAYHKLDSFADAMYVTRGTIENDLLEARELLEKFNLSIKSRPAYGMKVVGEEYKIRQAILEFVYYNSLSYYTVEINGLNDFEFLEETKMLLRNEFHHHLELSRSAYKEIAQAIELMRYRNALSFTIESFEMEAQDMIKEKMINVLRQLKIENYSNAEIKRLAILIESKSKLQKDDTQRFQDLMIQIMDEVYLNFGIDFRDNLEFKEQLRLHIIQVIKRNKNGTFLRNPMLYRTLRDHIFASKIAISAVEIMNRYFEIQLQEDEFSYIVLFFAYFLNSVEIDRTISINFVNNDKLIQNKVMMNELVNKYQDDKIRVYSNHQDVCDIQIVNDDTIWEYDVSTLDLNFHKNLKDKIKKLQDKSIEWPKYLNEKSVLKDIDVSTRDELKEVLIETLDKRDLLKAGETIPDDFVGLELGNQVLHLQDLGKRLKNPIFFIGILSRPIIWDKTTIRMVVIIKTKKDGDDDLHILCKALSNWVNDSKSLYRFIENPSVEKLYL